MKAIFEGILLVSMLLLTGALLGRSCSGSRALEMAIHTRDSVVVHDIMRLADVRSDTVYVQKWNRERVESRDTVFLERKADSSVYTGRLLAASGLLTLPDSGRLRMEYFDRPNPFAYDYAAAPSRIQIQTLERVTTRTPFITHGLQLGGAAAFCADGQIRPALVIGYGVQVNFGTIF